MSVKVDNAVVLCLFDGNTHMKLLSQEKNNLHKKKYPEMSPRKSVYPNKSLAQNQQNKGFTCLSIYPPATFFTREGYTFDCH